MAEGSLTPLMKLFLTLGLSVASAMIMAIWILLDDKKKIKELKKRNDEYYRARQETVVVEPVDQKLTIDTTLYT